MNTKEDGLHPWDQDFKFAMVNDKGEVISDVVTMKGIDIEENEFSKLKSVAMEHIWGEK